MRLTAKTIDKLPPVPRPTTYFDDDLKGFGLRVMPPSRRSETGSRSWVVEYRPGSGGRSVAKRRLTIGSAGVLEAGEARTRAKEILARVRLGEDPAGERAEERRSASVTDLAARYQQEAGVGRKERTKELYASYWRIWILPELGSLKARDVGRSDVMRLHRKVGAKYPTTANRVITLLSHFFGWAAELGAVPEGFNPAQGLDRFRESARERYLNGDELQRLGAALLEAETEGIPWHRPPGREWSKHAPKRAEFRRTRVSPYVTAAIRLLVLTGARLREILHLKWSEVDQERGLLLLSDSKTGRKPIVLGAAALRVLADLDEVGTYVITSDAWLTRPEGVRPSEERPRADLQRPWALICRRAGLVGVRLHDLRHTFASYGVAEGMGLPVIGGLLGHSDAKTTQRYAHLGEGPLRRASDAISKQISAALSRSTEEEVSRG